MTVRIVLPTLLCLLACATTEAATDWREISPLPQARLFHRAGVGAGGRVYAWAGLVGGPRGVEGAGLGERSLAVYDPVANAWSPGPPAPEFRARVRVTLTTSRPELKGTTRDHDNLRRLQHEYPPGVAANGRMYWFSSAGPIWFDSEKGVWTQGEPPLRQQGQGIPPAQVLEGRWLSSVSTWIRHNEVTAAGADGRIYLAGGTGKPQAHLPPDRSPPQSTGEVISLLDSLEIYDPATLTWSQGAPMKQARQLFAGTFAADGRLYVFGGFGHTGGVGQRPGESEESFEERTREMMRSRKALTSTEAYDPTTNTWSDRAPMPEARHAMGAALGADGRIYVVGGAVLYSSPAPTDTVFVYDPRSDTWERGPSLHQPRYHHAVVSGSDGKIYAIGGTSGTDSGEGGPLASVEMLDTAATAPGKDLPPVGVHRGGEDPRWIVALP